MKESITGYLSHPIRGKKGAAATVADMELNNKIAITAGQMIMKYCPILKLYVPGDHDEYVTLAYLRGTQRENDILSIDKVILARRDIIIAFEYQGVCSNGMRVELEEAKRLNIPSFTFSAFRHIPELVGSIMDWYYFNNLS